MAKAGKGMIPWAKIGRGIAVSLRFICRWLGIALWFILVTLLWGGIRRAARVMDEEWFSYVRGRIKVSGDQILSIRLVHYPEAFFYFPMVPVLYAAEIAQRNSMVSPGWVLFGVIVMAMITLVAVHTNLDFKRLMIVVLIVAVILLSAWVSTLKVAFNPLAWLSAYLQSVVFEKEVTLPVVSGVYRLGAYFIGFVCLCIAVYAWMYNRVEIDKSYVAQRHFPFGEHRDQIYARPVGRLVNDLVEAALLLSADVVVYLPGGRAHVFRNVPRAAVWGFARALDKLIDFQPDDLKATRGVDEDVALEAPAPGQMVLGEKAEETHGESDHHHAGETATQSEGDPRHPG